MAPTSQILRGRCLYGNQSKHGHIDTIVTDKITEFIRFEPEICICNGT